MLEGLCGWQLAGLKCLLGRGSVAGFRLGLSHHVLAFLRRKGLVPLGLDLVVWRIQFGILAKSPLLL